MSSDRDSLGIDVGSVTLKLALLSRDGELLTSTYEHHRGRPIDVLSEALADLAARWPEGRSYAVRVTGSARDMVATALGVPTANEIVAHAMAACQAHPDARTIIEIGGQDSKLITLGGYTASGDPEILSQQMNDVCAAGTGSFIEQQSEHLGISIDEFGPLALTSTCPATVAGRCSVFAKTDIVHLRQENVPPADIAAGLCDAVARNYLAQFLKGQKPHKTVLFQGGLAANVGVVQAFRRLLRLGDDEFVVPDSFRVMGALGCAQLATRIRTSPLLSIDDMHRNLRTLRHENHNSVRRLQPLIGGMYAQPRRYRSTSAQPAPAGHFMGIDVGSTSTCVAIVDGRGEVASKTYVLNDGSLLDVVSRAMQLAREEFSDGDAPLDVRGVGVTGSGRYLVSHFVGADEVRDEITAQTRAAVHLYPGVQTVIEIGGQDSKYIHLQTGTLAGFEMNKVCAAGTGAFLQEQSERLGVPVEQLGTRALTSKSPVDLGSRCTVFMESELINHQQRGVPHDDLVAGLSHAIAQNYLEKVVGNKPIGERILFLGGVAFNPSVKRALEQRLETEIVVPEHHEVSAALGMALIVRDTVPARTCFRGFDVHAAQAEVSSFRCGSCESACRVQKNIIDNQTFYVGGGCDLFEAKTDRTKKRRRITSLPNPFEERNELLMSYLRPAADGAEKIGVPRAQFFHELFPLCATFLQELGFEVVPSRPTTKKTIAAGLARTATDNCFASKLSYGHVDDLRCRGVTKLFYPSLIETERRVKDMERNYACPHVQAAPSLAALSFSDVSVVEAVFVRERGERDWREELLPSVSTYHLDTRLTR